MVELFVKVLYKVLLLRRQFVTMAQKNKYATNLMLLPVSVSDSLKSFVLLAKLFILVT